MAAHSLQNDGSPAEVRRAVLRLQRGVHRLVQAEVRAYTGGSTPALERYYREYMREFRAHHHLSSFGELFQSILDADVFFVGDYHTLRQSQELACRLLERAAAETRPLVLAVEMVHEEHQRHLDAWMRRQIGETEFLERIDYGSTWNFNWENYRPLFDTARRAGVRVVGINHHTPGDGGGIRARDEAIADSLVSCLLRWPAARVMVLIGDLHLASNHLPHALDERLQTRGLRRRRLIVYQNSDTLFWTLAERGHTAEARVVRLGDDRFCVMEVPPYVKLQSYLGWEQAVERMAEPEEGESEPTYSGLFGALARQLGRFLDLPPLQAGFEVYTNLDEQFFATMENAGDIGDARLREVTLLAFGNRSCFVPELDVVYLPYFSVNHASEEAMHVLQAQHGGFTVPADLYEAFYARIWNAALGFFASKLVNPRRVATSEGEFRTFLRTASRRLHEPQLAFRKLVARFVVQHKRHERERLDGGRGRLQQIYAQDLDVLLEVTFGLGYILGEQLAAALHDGRIGPGIARALVVDGDGAAPSERYFGLLRRLTA